MHIVKNICILSHRSDVKESKKLSKNISKEVKRYAVKNNLLVHSTALQCTAVRDILVVNLIRGYHEPVRIKENSDIYRA